MNQSRSGDGSNLVGMKLSQHVNVIHRMFGEAPEDLRHCSNEAMCEKAMA
jgi:hypothetical protein